MTDFTTREGVLEIAKNLITSDRQEQYGSFKDQMEDVAAMATILTGKHLIASDIALILMALKMKRITTSKKDLDSEIDLCGYTALYAEWFKSPMDSDDPVGTAT